MPKNSTPLTLLAFDFGMKKIGIAVGQTLSQTATPLKKIKAQDGIPSWNTIKDLIEEWHVNALIVGIPYNMDGSYQEITHAAKKFGNRLSEKFQMPVYFVDERLSTVEAQSNLRHHSDDIDSLAAKLILESWLREHATKKN